MASLIKQKNWYYAQFYNTNHSPKQKRVRLRTRTKTTAVKLLRKLEDQYALGEYNPWTDDVVQPDDSEFTSESPLKEVVAEFINVKTKKDWRANTATTSEYVLNDFVSSVGSQLPAEAIKEDDFNTFINKSDIKYETRKSYRKTLRTLLLWMNELGLSNLSSKKLHVDNDSMEQSESINYYTPDDIQKLTSYIRDKVTKDLKKGYQKEHRNALWLIDFIHWQRLSGMRLSETLNLRAGDINTDTWEITIGNAHFVTKSKKKQILPIESVVPLKKIAIKLLEESSSRKDRLFGHSCRRHTHRMFKRYLRKALPDKQYLNIHSLRHTCCIELLRAGVPIYTVQRWLRHSDVKTTQRYADLLNMDISDQIGRAFSVTK